MAAELKKIYSAETAELAAERLEDLARPFGKKDPGNRSMLAQSMGTGHPVFAYPNEIRKIIYTTNAIESLHMQLRKVLKTRGHFPSDEAATKLIYLALRDITKKWKNPPVTWKLAANPICHSIWSKILCRRDLKKREANHCQSQKDKRWALEPIGFDTRLTHNRLYPGRHAAAT